MFVCYANPLKLYIFEVYFKIMPEIKLNIEDDFDFDCIAISSVESDFKIAFHLNKLLNLNLSKKQNILHPFIVNEESHQRSFPYFFYKDEAKHRTYQLIQNKTQEDIYLKKQKNADYLFLIKGTRLSKDELVELNKKIKNIPGVLLTFIINIKEEKDRDLLLI